MTNLFKDFCVIFKQGEGDKPQLIPKNVIPLHWVSGR